MGDWLIKKLRKFIPSKHLDGVLEDTKDLVDHPHCHNGNFYEWRENNALDSLCSKLSKNDGTLTHISSKNWIDGKPYGNSLRLTRALMHNSHVSTLDISMESLQSNSGTGMETCNGWTAYIRGSEALRTLCIQWHQYRDFEYDQSGVGILARSLLDAVDTNTGLKAVHFMGYGRTENKVPCTWLAQLLRTERMLRVLEINALHLTGDTALLAHALGTNRSLESIHLTICTRGDWALVPPLGLIPCLDEVCLRLGGYVEVDDAFFDFLANHTLRHLKLLAFSFSKPCMERFLDVLRCRPVLHKISVHHCSFLDSSDRLLVEYIQQSALCEFAHFGICNELRSIEAWAGLFGGPSALRVLGTEFEDNGACGLSNWLMTNSNQIRVPHLHLHTSTISSYLATCIERLCHVTTVTVFVFKDHQRKVAFGSILFALKRNGSLHSVSFEWNDSLRCKSSPLSSAQAKMLNMYGQRNQILSTLLFKSPVRTDLCFFPTLLAAAGTMGKGSSHTATLLGLMALNSHNEHDVGNSSAIL